jgi:hypothetical protein
VDRHTGRRRGNSKEVAAGETQTLSKIANPNLRHADRQLCYGMLAALLHRMQTFNTHRKTTKKVAIIKYHTSLGHRFGGVVI